MKKAAALLILFSSFITPAHSRGDLVTPQAPGNSPLVIVYKTKQNFDKCVPVVLSQDRQTIVSYPAPQDLMYHGKFAYPTKLAKGYRLDNRGLNVYSAFLDITYTEYSKMKEVDPAELMHHIKSSEPFLFFYRCDKRNDYKNIVRELNAKIKKGTLTNCECLVKP
jgi:hypothetical protein